MNKFKELIAKLQWSHVAIIGGLAAAFFYFTLDTSEVEMREQALQAVQSETASLEKKLQEAKDFERQFEEKKKKYAQLVSELQQLQGALPKQFFLPDLLSELLKEAKQLEIEVTSITPDGKEEQKDLYNSLGFNIETKSTFLQLFIFLDRLASMRRLVSVQDISFDLDGEREKVTLGGQEGAFAGSKLTGGRTVYPGIKSSIRVLTYRYVGSAAPAKEGAAGGVVQ